MSWGSRRTYTVESIAETGPLFRDFGPYVPALRDDGSVAFQAAMMSGDSAVCTGGSQPVRSLFVSRPPTPAVCSHPDVSATGEMCCYAETATGAREVLLVCGGVATTLATDAGPLGPTINDQGTVAYRTLAPSGTEAIWVASRERAVQVARTGDAFRGFQGLPVVSQDGRVVFRADLADGRAAVFLWDRGRTELVVESGEVYSAIANFPAINCSGTVSFAAVLQGGGSVGCVASCSRIETVVSPGGDFAHVRGVLLDDCGIGAVIATPKGGSLGVYSGPDAERDRVLELGRPFLGSPVEDFALNPVSINGRGELAIRARLADGRQHVLRCLQSGPS